MKLTKRYNLLMSNLLQSNISDWRLLIVHPNTAKVNHSEESEIKNDSPKILIDTVQYGDQLIPLYCTILGLVIVCLVAYVIYKLWKQKNNALHCTAISSKASSGNSFRIPKYSPSNKSKSKSMAALINSTEEEKWQNVEESLLNKPLHCLPEDQIEAIIFSLSDESSGVGWINLAQYFNVQNDEIQSSTNSGGVRIFLKKWSENPNNNLKKLIKGLHEIARPDTVFLIKSSLRKLNENDFPNNENNNNLLSRDNRNHETVIIT